jgi:nitrogen-specific signal transduction histidine kinase
MQRPLAASSSIELRVDVDGDLPDIWGDKDRLLQVFENLIGNAIKFTKAGGSITVGRRRGITRSPSELRIQALVSRRRTCLISLTDSGKHPGPGVPAPGSDFPSPKVSSRLTGDASGSKAQRKRQYVFLHDSHSVCRAREDSPIADRLDPVAVP